MARKRFSEMTTAELEEYDRSDRYTRGRADAFTYGRPETVLEYWEHDEPTDSELREIVKNLLRHFQGEPLW